MDKRWKIGASHGALFVAGVTVGLFVRDFSSARTWLPPTPRAIVNGTLAKLSSRARPPKLEVARAILAAPPAPDPPTLFIHLDARRRDVVVPAQFVGDSQLVLQVGYSMAIPIPDLKLDERGFSATLSFGGEPFLCKVPWAAVYALVGDDGRGMLYPEDTPPDVQAKMDSAKPAE